MADRLSDDSIKKMAGSDHKDRFEDLPEDVLRLLLSFMDSRDAVGTSRLARRWRNLWKSVPSIRILSLCIRANEYEKAQAFFYFVDKLLEFRERTAPLDVGEICCPRGCEQYGGGYEGSQYLESWVQYAVSCKVSVLRINKKFVGDHGHMQLSNRSIISKHLTVLDLHRLEFEERPLDFSSCQKLEVLEIFNCFINLGDIFPKSLRCLKIKYSFLLNTKRTRLSAPGLVTLELNGCLERTPLLESLPSLVTAYIKIADIGGDLCHHNYYFGDCGDELCDGCYGIKDDCSVFLEGLSGATNLELIMELSMIFRKDLKWCPMFRNLKTLLLNEWCVGANFSGLVYFLQHSPVLERLSLQLRHRKYSDIEAGESYNPKEHFLVSQHLKIVEIYCREEEEIICQILKILGTHGVNDAQIDIKHNYRVSTSFSFEQKK